MTERLTTLAAVKDWLDISSDKSDTALIRLIQSASQFTLNYMSRDCFGVRTYTQNFRGTGKSYTMVRNWPIVSVSSVGIAGRLMVPSVLGVGGLPSSGYTISDARSAPQIIEVYGDAFYQGAPSQIIYDAGYRTSQSTKIPASTFDPATSYAVITPTKSGQWLKDLGVTINNVAATKVDANPTVGQYTVGEWGDYTFNVADTNKTAVISYDYAPADVAQAVTELIGEWYRRKDRIGLLSKTLGGQETVTFSQKDMNDSIKRVFNFYSNVVPI